MTEAQFKDLKESVKESKSINTHRALLFYLSGYLWNSTISGKQLETLTHIIRDKQK